MADYKSMYYHLLRAQLKAIGVMQNAHIDTEKLFMDSKDPIELLNTENEHKDEEQE